MLSKISEKCDVNAWGVATRKDVLRTGVCTRSTLMISWKTVRYLPLDPKLRKPLTFIEIVTAGGIVPSNIIPKT
jgi:hypothetical protein